MNMCKSRLFLLMLINVTIYQCTETFEVKKINTTDSRNKDISMRFNLIEPEKMFVEISELLLDLIEKINVMHCFALVFDDVYSSVLSVNLFQRIHYAARFTVRIAQDEDTLNPRHTLKCILEEIRNEGCDGYIMLMANGIQMEGLLRFGDKTRVIDTRARFIVLHNYRLFVPELHYIWKRIVNVIFIRRVRQSRFHFNKIPRFASSIYELSTVPFPIPIKGVFFSKIVNFWYGGKYRLVNHSFFDDKTNDLGLQTMRVVVLEHAPAVFKTTNTLAIPSHIQTSAESTVTYYGLEIELLKAISKAMRFRLEFYETPDADVEQWGTLQDNDTLSGLLKDMHEGLADFALADLHHTEYHLGFMDLSIPYNTECLTFLTPEALSDNTWKTLVLPFNGQMWTGVLISLFFVCFVFYAFSNTSSYMHQYQVGYRPDYDLVKRHVQRRSTSIHPLSIFKQKRGTVRIRRHSHYFFRRLPNIFKNHKNRKTKLHNIEWKLRKMRMVSFKRKPEPWHDPLPAKDIFDTLASCMLYTYSMLLLVSLPRLPNAWSLRVLTGWYWVYCVLVVVAYRASFTAILANPIPRVTIDTLQDLAISPIRCGAWGEQNRLFFQMAQDPHSQAIGVKLEHSPNPIQAVEQVAAGMYAYYENVYLLRQLRSTMKSAKDRQTLHIMQQCAVHMPISIGMEKNSPLKYQVDRFVRALVEGGLTRKWLSDAIEQFQSNVELPPQEATIDLKKMYAGIVALCLGYTLGLLVFIVEKLYWINRVETNPAFDKYLFGLTLHKRT